MTVEILKHQLHIICGLGMTKSCGCLRNDRIVESQQVVPSEDIEKIRREYFDKKRNKR